MATLICPACGARYQVQAVFPPGGRKARCYKCGQVWLATPVFDPDKPVSEATPVEPASVAPAESASAAASVRKNVGTRQPSPPPHSAAAVTVAPDFSGIVQPAAPQPTWHPIIKKSQSLRPASAFEEGMRDAEMGVDLASEAFPDEKPATARRLVVAIGWLVLALVVASVVGTLVLAPSAVVSVLPGATRLYTFIGAPVDLDGLAFRGVRYAWTTENGQDVLEVQGEVVNNALSSVSVPSLLITLQDGRGNEVSKWTTEVSKQELAGGEHASFLRQIPSPPSDVRSAKVHFGKHD